MKKFLISLMLFLVIVGSARAQQQHMFEFNADSLERGIFSFDKSKYKGSNVDNSTQLDLLLNYAYTVAPNLQVGTRANYVKSTTSVDQENWGLQVGAIYNFLEDFKNSHYASIYAGMQWDHTYSGSGTNDEIIKTTIAFGKRFSLSAYGIDHVVYSPELALEMLNSTTNSSLDYSQSIQFRFLQFSVFF